MKEQPKKVTGGCLCGKVRYEAQVFLKSGYYCHCRICQKSSGQPAEIAVQIKAGTLVFTKSEPKYYVSSEHGKRGFCDVCGARLLWQALDPQNDWMTNVTVGSLDNSAEAEPSLHIFVDTKLPWYKSDEQLPKFREAEIEVMLGVWKQDRTPDD
jgi:hypothetical protein